MRAVNKADWLRHENFYPVIIEKAIWQQVQTRLKQQARPAVNNRTKHRYAGLLACQECGNVFSPMIRYWNGGHRVEYVCRVTNGTGKVIAALTGFMKKFWIKPSGIIQKSCENNTRRN